jgi:hypothetical protein
VDEVHRCASGVLVEARTGQGEVLDSGRVAAGASGQTRVTADGKVVLTSDILNFLCGGVLNRPPIRVRAELPSQLPVVSLGTLSAPLTVDISSTLAGLPQSNGEPPREFDLVIERDRPVCGIGGEGVVELCRIHVNTMGFEGSMSGVWSGGCPVGGVSGTFQIAIDREGTVTGTYDGSASGDITGTVTTNGSLSAVASGGPCDWTGTLSLAGGNLTGSGSWTCAADCSGGFSSTP